MKTLYLKEEGEEEKRSSAADPLVKKVSFPNEIVEDILSRLPVKSILQSHSVSKTWLNLLSNPSFNKLHFTRATTTHRRTAFLFSACNYSTKKRYYFTAAKDGGPLTLLMKIDEDTGPFFDTCGPSHLNGRGLVCFTCRTYTHDKCIDTHAFVVNPTTRKVFRLPDMNSPSNEYNLTGYLYGYDESRNEHKTLLVKYVYKTKKLEFTIFSMSSFSWRKIDGEPPVVDFDWGRLGDGLVNLDGGVCVNSVVYVMLQDMSFDILAFDFVTEKFSVISLPRGVFPPRDVSLDFDTPHITKINGCLAVVVHKLNISQVHMWLLKDYDNPVWVKEIIKLPNSWNMKINGFPLSIDGNMDDEIVFNTSKVTENRVNIHVYNRKTKQFKTLEFNLDDQFASVTFHHITCYVETMLPLSDNWSIKSHGQSE